MTSIDGRVDNGLFSLKLLPLCPSIHRILAFESNQEGISCIKFNLDRPPFPAEAYRKPYRISKDAAISKPYLPILPCGVTALHSFSNTRHKGLFQ